MFGKKKGWALLGLVVALLVLGAMPAQAKTLMNAKTVKAGKTIYIMDKNISGNAVISNYFKAERQTSGTKYDLVFARGTASNPSVSAVVNLTKDFTSSKTNAYIKASASANTGILVGIRVRSGSVKLSLYNQVSDGGFRLSVASTSASPLRARTLPKNRYVNFRMAAGNVKNIPLIFGGTSGTRIKRMLSSTKYELYVFGASNMKRMTYVNNKADKSTKVTIQYTSAYTLSGKTYLCALILIPKSSSTYSSGWMQNIKGNAVFLYPREALGISYQTK